MEKLHSCQIPDELCKTDSWGIAISECYEQEETFELWVSNGEYSNQVAFCPFCGYSRKKNSELIGLYSGKPVTLECDISEIHTSVRLFNAICAIFGSAKSIKIRDIISLEQKDLMKIRNIGLRTWQELDRIKMSFGF